MPSNHSSSTAQKPDRRHYDDSRPIRAEYKYHVAGIDSLTDLSPTRSCALSLASTSQPLSALTCRRLYCCSGSILELCRADLNLILLLLSPLASLFPFSVCFTFFFFFFAGLFLCPRKHVVVEHLPQAQHSPCTLHKPAKQASEYVPIRARQRKPADRIWREPAYRRAFTQLAVLSERTKTLKSAQKTVLVLLEFASHRFASTNHNFIKIV